MMMSFPMKANTDYSSRHHCLYATCYLLQKAYHATCHNVQEMASKDLRLYISRWLYIEKGRLVRIAYCALYLPLPRWSCLCLVAILPLPKGCATTFRDTVTFGARIAAVGYETPGGNSGGRRSRYIESV